MSLRIFDDRFSSGTASLSSSGSCTWMTTQSMSRKDSPAMTHFSSFGLSLTPLSKIFKRPTTLAGRSLWTNPWLVSKGDYLSSNTCQKSPPSGEWKLLCWLTARQGTRAIGDCIRVSLNFITYCKESLLTHSNIAIIHMYIICVHTHVTPQHNIP